MPHTKAYRPDPNRVLAKLKKTRLLRKYPNRLRDGMGQPVVPNFFDTISFGEIVNDHDYVARFMMMVVPGYWEGWLQACDAIATDPNRRRSQFSAHEVLVEFRNKRQVGKKPDCLPFAIANAHGAALMRLVQRLARNGDPRHPYVTPLWEDKIQTAPILRVVPEVMGWVFRTPPELPQPV